jgi:steroid delta-isomerase-like uncharacterized protein
LKLAWPTGKLGCCPAYFERIATLGEDIVDSQNGYNIKEIITQAVEAWNAHDAAGVASFYAPDYVGIDSSEPGQQRGPDGVRHTVQRYLNAFPDLQLIPEQMVVNSEHAAVKLIVRGTHQGGIMRIPPTGRQTKIHGVAFVTFANGKIIEASYLWDVAGFLRDIGLLPDL